MEHLAVLPHRWGVGRARLTLWGSLNPNAEPLSHAIQDSLNTLWGWPARAFSQAMLCREVATDLSTSPWGMSKLGSDEVVDPGARRTAWLVVVLLSSRWVLERKCPPVAS